MEASHGAEALRLSRDHAGPLHLVVTDMVMPGMSGRQLVERLEVLRPETRFIFISGYDANQFSPRTLLPQGSAYISKPFTPGLLMTKIREVLGTG